MGINTKIPWANHTWNPWQGCHPVSAGCQNCYMFRDKKRYGQDPNIVIRSNKRTFELPLRTNGPAMVFVCSWSDFFIEEADPWRAEAWEIMRSAPRLTYLILTKRPERIRQCLPYWWNDGSCSLLDDRKIYARDNIWLGVTVENSQSFSRIEILKNTPASKRFISAEPLLENISNYSFTHLLFGEPVIDWVIAGCESGPNARPMELEWARRIKELCTNGEPKIKFFFKQAMINGKIVSMPELDGKVWKEFPN